MFDLAQIPNTIGFLLKKKYNNNDSKKDDLNKNIVTLETSFKPFKIASSISH